MWEKIKKILQKEGGKCIIMQEKGPSYIVMRLGDYEECLENNLTETEKINQDIAEWKSEKTAIQSEALLEDELLEKDTERESASSSQEVKIEDLPF